MNMCYLISRITLRNLKHIINDIGIELAYCFTISMKSSTGAAWEYMLSYIILVPMVDTYGGRMTVWY